MLVASADDEQLVGGPTIFASVFSGLFGIFSLTLIAARLHPLHQRVSKQILPWVSYMREPDLRQTIIIAVSMINRNMI